MLTAATTKRDDFAEGVAITSSIHPEPTTHVEVCRYGKGQNALFAITAPLVDGGAFRLLRFLLVLLRHPVQFLRSRNGRGASEHGVILLVMQSLDNSLTSFRKRGPLGHRLVTRQGTGEPNPDWIPIAHDVARRYAKKIDGFPLGTYADVFNIPTTAHYIGGCVIGQTPEDGVIDPYQRLFGYPGVHVVDGSAISANLGVNPSLTITAQAERALAFWPNKGEPDPRPGLGEAYRPIAPVAPKPPRRSAGRTRRAAPDGGLTTSLRKRWLRAASGVVRRSGCVGPVLSCTLRDVLQGGSDHPRRCPDARRTVRTPCTLPAPSHQCDYRHAQHGQRRRSRISGRHRSLHIPARAGQCAGRESGRA